MIDQQRIFHYNRITAQNGCVVYWMQRDQRATGNWALLYAQERALAMQQPLMVVFCLVPDFMGATIRQYGFMIKGLENTACKLAEFNISFTLLHGSPHEVLPRFIDENEVGLLVTDFNPLRVTMEWKRQLTDRIAIAFHEVDAHNIVPCRYISGKSEYAAFALRKKVEQRLPGFLTHIPEPLKHPDFKDVQEFPTIDWTMALRSLPVDKRVPEAEWLDPGETAAESAAAQFIAERLGQYDNNRNFPEKSGQSDLSPYLHFGHLSAQRLALEVRDCSASGGSRIAFLEELIVRRELADNFCLHNPDYDNYKGLQPWARATLDKHRDDPRDFIYSTEQFEQSLTHDLLWNAAQHEMVATGKMHGYMRMYWAKKILEWSQSPEEAIAIAIYLNDKYELDGRDPSGYAGIAWAIGGTHDRPWGERKIFGMIRYMNYQGCKRKFNVDKYIGNTHFDKQDLFVQRKS